MAFLLLFVIFWNFFLGAYTFTIRKKKIDDVIPCFRGTCPHDLRRGFASLPGFLSRSPPSHLYPPHPGLYSLSKHYSTPARSRDCCARGHTCEQDHRPLPNSHILSSEAALLPYTHTHTIIIRTVTIVPPGKKENSRNFRLRVREGWEEPHL